MEAEKKESNGRKERREEKERIEKKGPAKEERK
jgi:hypothetical protein